MTGTPGSEQLRAPDPDFGLVHLEVDDTIATVVLDRAAKLNALTPEMLDQLEHVLARIEASDDVRAVLVASAGERAFCAGADIRRFGQLDGTAMWAHWTRRGHQVFDRLAALRQPTVVAVDGIAFGGGLELLLACDLRVLADDATLGLTEVGLGTVPGWGGTQRLTQQVGAARTKQLVLTGDPIDARTALEWGIVTTVTTREQVRAEALRLAQRITERAPVAVQMAKQAVDLAAGTRSGLAIEGFAAAASAAVPDFREGLSAFTERREAAFTGLAAPTHHEQQGHHA